MCVQRSILVATVGKDSRFGVKHPEAPAGFDPIRIGTELP